MVATVQRHSESDAGTRRLLWDEENILLESNTSDVAQVVYTLEPAGYGNLISQRRSSTTSFFLFDALGSTRKLTSSAAAVTDSYDFKAYGETNGTSGSTVNVFKWVGELGYYYDIDRLAYYLRARPYSPRLARFLSEDPLEFADGPNVFRYAMSIPSTYLDPSGEMDPGIGRLIPPIQRTRRRHCGNLSVFCPVIGRVVKHTNVPVYGNSGWVPFDGCVTYPWGIECSGDCAELPTLLSADNDDAPLLDHEACHWCALFVGGYFSYICTWGFAPDPCVGNEIPSNFYPDILAN